MNAIDQDPRRVIRKLNRAGLALTVLLVGGVGGWAATSQLAGAVIASGNRRAAVAGSAPPRRA
jgi:HlyD family secretion protein